MVTHTPSALIVGAGIGGLAAALALRRAGCRVTVVERAATPRELGFALLLAPNAMHALTALGVAEPIRAGGVIVRTGEMRRPDGTVLRRFDAGKVRAALGEDTCCILRPVLHGALLDAVGPDALRLGQNVTGYVAEGDHLRLLGPDVAVEPADLVIGADGVGSAIRRQLHPTEAPARPSGLLAFRGVARNAVQHLGGVSGAQYFGIGCEAGVAQASASDVYWYLSVRADRVTRIGGTADAPALLRRAIEPFHAPFRALVDATSPDDVRLDTLLVRDPLASWGQGRVTLLGDAAHPMLPHAGQGAAQAIEDAVALGRRLTPDAPVEPALRAYERVRAARTSTVVRLAQRNARAGSIASGIGCVVRDAAIRLVPESVILRSLIALGRPPE